MTRKQKCRSFQLELSEKSSALEQEEEEQHRSIDYFIRSRLFLIDS